jgi:hypothetical protein
MKKRRLKKWVKIALTAITIIASAVIYHLNGVYGSKAQEGINYLIIMCLSWIWLFFGQISAYYFIWAD